MNNVFTPKADEALNTFMVATVKQSSGYLALNGFGPEALEFAKADAVARGGRVVVTLTPGETEWQVANLDAVDIPDTLPDDFK